MGHRRVIAAALICACLLMDRLAPAVAAQEHAAADRYAAPLAEFESFVHEQMHNEQTPGMTIGFFDGDYVWVKAFGYSDLENHVPAKPESAYRLASVTKTMTAVAVLQLVEQGKIDLDSEIQKYVPYFPKKKYPVTVRQLLGHMGGITAYKTAAEELIREPKSTREAIDIFSKYDLIAAPDSTFSYSSYGYNLLGAAIETAAGEPYGEYLRHNIWDPLGMKDTRMDNPLDLIPNRVRGYQLVNGEIKNSEYVNISSRFAAGGTRSTVPDLLTFARAMADGKLLTAQSRDMMWTSMVTRDGQFTGYGMGWWTDSMNGRFVVRHGGSQQEAQTALLIMPTHHFGIAITMNFENATPWPYVERLYALILDEPWSIDAYAKKEKDRIVLSGMDTAFDYGMRYLDQYGKPLTTDAAELREAFAYFNRAVESPAKEAEQAMAKGRHPQANQAFVKMASFMGAKLHEARSDARFNDYYRRGAITLFAGYVEWYRSVPGHPSELRFSKTFEKQIERWNADWARSWNNQTRRLRITESSNLTQTGELLRGSFAHASVYPSFINDFAALVTLLNDRAETNKALEAGQLAVALYPDAPLLHAELAVSQVLAGNQKRAAALLARADQLHTVYTSAAGLNYRAHEMSSSGQPKAAIMLLEIAIQMHPKQAFLYDTMGELYLSLGNQEKAVEFYTRALAIDPSYDNAATARDVLKRLGQRPSN